MANYIMDLRKYIGHRPIMMVGAGVLLIDSKDRVLLQRRTDNDCWGVPGGAVELGETVEEAAKREVFEETGLRVRAMTSFGVFSGEELHYIYPNGDEVYTIANVLISNDFDGEIKLDPEESKEIKFFDSHNLPDKINPPDQPIVKDFIDKLKKRTI